METVIPKISEIWPSIIAFVILFALLYRFAFPMITNMLQERADKIAESLEKAEETRVEAERLLDDYKKQMAEARHEAGKIVEDSRKVAESMKDEIVARANEEAEEVKTKALAAIEAEKRSVMSELQASVAALSTELAGKIIGTELDEAKHKGLIKSYLDEVGSLDER